MNDLVEKIDYNQIIKSSTLEVEVEIENENKLDLEKFAIDKNNLDYSSIGNGVIELGCYELFDLYLIDYSIFNKPIENYDLESKKQDFEVSRHKNSYMKEFFNKLPRVNSKDLVLGKTLNREIKFQNGICVDVKNRFA